MGRINRKACSIGMMISRSRPTDPENGPQHGDSPVAARVVVMSRQKKARVLELAQGAGLAHRLDVRIGGERRRRRRTHRPVLP